MFCGTSRLRCRNVLHKGVDIMKWGLKHKKYEFSVVCEIYFVAENVLHKGVEKKCYGRDEEQVVLESY